MFKFRSLTAKFIFMGIIILGFIAVNIAATYVFTHHMEGEAKRINLAGKERMILVDIGRHSLQFADMPPSQERADIIEDVKQKMKLYEEILLGLRDGSKKHALPPMHSHAKEAIKQNNKLLEMWEKVQKSEIERMMNMPDKGKAREYNLHLYVYVDEIDKLVTLIEKHSENEIKDFDAFRYYAFGFFFLLISFIVLYIRQSIIKPVWRLMEATREIEKGNFDIKVDVKSRDEILGLSEHFTHMARSLDINLAENTRLIKNLTAVNKATNIIMSNLLIDEVLNRIVEEARNLTGSKYCALGIIHPSGEGYEFYIPKGIEPELLEEMKKKIGIPVGKGLLGYLTKEGKPVRVDDISKHPASIGFPKGHPPMKVFLGVPVMLHEKVIGRLYFTDKHPSVSPLDKGGIEGGFTQEDEDLASSFANTAAIAINNARLLSTVTSSNENLTALNVIAHAASQTLAVEVMLNNVLNAILNLGPLRLERKGAIFLYEEKKGLRLIVSKNFSNEQTELCSSVPFGECLCGIAAEKGEMLISDSSSEDKRHSKTYAGAKEHGHVILPLKGRDKILGVLCLYLPAGTKLSNLEIGLYKSIAEMVSIATQNAINHRQVALLAQSLESSSDAIIITDTEGRITHVNSAGIRQTGYTTDELIGKHVSMLRSYNITQEQGENIFRKTLEGGWEGELYSQRKDGSDYPAFLTTSPVRDIEGDIIATISIARDITERKKIEEALQASEETYRMIVSNIDEIVYSVKTGDDPLAGKVWFVSSRVNDIIGYKPDDFYETPELWFSIIHPEDIPSLTKSTKRFHETLKKTTRFYRIKHKKTSEYRWLEDSISPRLDDHGNLVGIFGVARDVTERMLAEGALRKSETSLREAQRIANLGNWDWDIVNNTLYWSDEVYRIFGLEPQQFGATYEAFLNSVHPDDREFVKQSVSESLSGGKPYSIDHRIILPDGLERVIYEQAEVILSGSGTPVRMIGTVQDITERKEMERKLREYTDNLEQLVKARTQELENAMQAASAANRAKSDFLANMSHELRTPLNSIIGFSELMYDGLAGSVTDDQKEYLGDVVGSGKHLLSLINDILDLSKVEAGKMDLEPSELNLRELIEGSLVMIKEKAMKHGIKIKAEVDEGIENITADERKIKQVLFNLLSNAMKFTPDGGSVRVAARKVHSSQFTVHGEENTVNREPSTMNNRNFIEISVTDTGIGISPEDQSKLFQPFQQLAATLTKKHEGTGLGLNLSRKFVELHGGRIWAESEPGKGSRFVFVIPVKQNSESRIQESE